MFRVGIAPDKAEDADGLAPIKDDNAVWHNSRRNRLKVFMGVQYEAGVSLLRKTESYRMRPGPCVPASFLCEKISKNMLTIDIYRAMIQS